MQTYNINTPYTQCRVVIFLHCIIELRQQFFAQMRFYTIQVVEEL